jgi:hypothetical protein
MPFILLTTCEHELDIDNHISSNVLEEHEENTIQLLKVVIVDMHGIRYFTSCLGEGRIDFYKVGDDNIPPKLTIIYLLN